MKNFGGLFLILLLQGCSPFNSNLVVACEQLIKQRLNSPSTYSRIDLHTNRDTEDPGPTNFAVVITYEAADALGVTLRDQVLCEYFSKDGSVLNASIYNVELEM